MLRSLRLQLGIGLTVVLAVVVAMFALGLHAMTARALLQGLDERLAGDASAVAGMVEQGEAGTPELENESLPDFEAGATPAYYQIWLDDGRVLSRSPSLAGRDLGRDAAVSSTARYRDVVLPDGRAGRSIALRARARAEDAALAPKPSAGAEQRVTVVVARGIEPISKTLGRLRDWLWAMALVTVLAGSGAMFFALSRGLRPVKAYASALAQLDDTRLRAISSAAELPSELDPIRGKLDELFARLAESFARERRFTADVAHELRTPIAALRTILDVVQMRERSGEGYRAAIAEAAQVTSRMQLLVDDLLLMSRLDSRQIQIQRQPVVLKDLVDECWSPLAARARERGLTFRNEAPPAASIQSDPEKLKIIVSNLLSNAVEYTAPGGTIAVRRIANAAGSSLEVWDSGPEIPADTLPRIFDRFFRADPARAGERGHAGIGLSLVKSLADVLGMRVTAQNVSQGGVSFRVEPEPLASLS
jgi:two-component system sensor histidine kinase QseC